MADPTVKPLEQPIVKTNPEGDAVNNKKGLVAVAGDGRAGNKSTTTVPGGRFIVRGVAVNCEGVPLKELFSEKRDGSGIDVDAKTS
jgi:hypothetical protein